MILRRVDSAKREDIELRRFPIPEPHQTAVRRPPSERGGMRWDKNPWEAVSGDFFDARGSLERDGVFWMLPYWMGRCYGYIRGRSDGGRSADWKMQRTKCKGDTTGESRLHDTPTRPIRMPLPGVYRMLWTFDEALRHRRSILQLSVAQRTLDKRIRHPPLP